LRNSALAVLTLIIGVSLLASGVYTLFGLGWTLLICGVVFILLAILAIDVDEPIERDTANDG